MFMVFQLLHPNVLAVVLCCCNNMFMVFQLLHPNVTVVVPFFFVVAIYMFMVFSLFQSIIAAVCSVLLE
jgi:hypothetical protein